MSIFARLVIIASASLALAACGGQSSSGAPAGGVPAKPSSSAAGTSAKPPASTSGGAASAQVVGQKAPGPYSANGSVTATNGQASLEATDTLKWQPDTIVVKGGDKVTLSIKNAGNTAHTFLSPALGVNSQQDVAVQKTTTVSFTAPSAPGAYQFWCNIPGHAEAGMVGEVIVQ